AAGPRRAGVSAFGVSGTNAHIIVAEAPAPEDAGVPETRGGDGLLAGAPLAWPVSGRTAAGLAAQAGRLARWVAARPEADPADVAWSLATGRAGLEHRALVTGASAAELAAGLAAVAAGDPAPGVVTGVVPLSGTGRTGFVFAGQGSQRAGMGAQLHACSPVFAQAFDQACGLLEAELGVPVAEVVLGSGEDDRADQTLYAQAGLFAVEAGLVALLAACGVTPDAVAGHSVGEVTAAYAAGVLTLEDACRLVAARARLMQALPAGGAMTAIAAAEAEVTQALEGVAGVSVAAVNGPSSVVVSGDAEAVGQVAGVFRDRGVRVRGLRVSHAFHSHRMDPVLGELAGVAARLAYAVPRIPWAGALTGELVSEPGAGYWARQAREPVRFADAVMALAGQGVSVFVEIGPDGTLSALGPAALGERDGVFVPVLRPDRPAAASVLAALARAHVHGAAVDWPAVFGGGRPVDLPTYAFQHQRYWPPLRPAQAEVAALGLGLNNHPLLAAAAELAGGRGFLFAGRVSVPSHPWLAGHVVAGRVLLPETAFVELAVRAGDAAGCSRLADLTVTTPLVLPGHTAAHIQVLVGAPAQDGQRPVEIYARAEGAAVEDPWTRHATGRLAQAAPAGAFTGAEDFTRWPPEGADVVPAGPEPDGVRAAWRRGADVFAEVALPDDDAAGAGAFGLHPALLSAALRVAELTGERATPGAVSRPQAWTGVTLHAAGASVLRVRLRPGAGDTVTLAAADDQGTPVLSAEKVLLLPVPPEQLAEAGDGLAGALFGVEWVPVAGGGAGAGDDAVAVSGVADGGAAVADAGGAV
ncbi:MAG TPA: acyltransferase domain-containing protein, partial [Streptosporangiaceae bacterium]